MVDISLSSKKKKSREEKYQPRHQKPSLPAVTARAAAARRRSWGRAMIAQARASQLAASSGQTNAKPGMDARAVRATLNNAGRVSGEDFVLSSPGDADSRGS